MKTSLTRGWLICGGLLVAMLIIGITTAGRADVNDFSNCTAQQYDRVRTESEMAATIGACTRVLESPAASPLQHAHAYYFRGLNYFLDAVRLAIAERQPIGSAGAAVQRLVQSALDDLAACIDIAPKVSALPYSLRATIHTVYERYDAALADLEQAIRIDPKTSSHFVQRALIWERTDRFSQARADLDAAIALDGKNQNAWINRAKLWTRYGDIEQAMSDYDMAEAVGGTQTWDALSGRAKIAVRLGDPSRAFADWTKAAELSPLPTLAAQFYVRAGNLARDYLKQPDRAEKSYRRAFDVFANYPDAFIQLGIAYERANRFDEAAKEYGKAIELTRAIPLERAVHDYARYRLDVMRSRLSRKPDGPPLPPNINVLRRPREEFARDGSKRVALVVGNAAYGHVPPLMNADRDAETVAEALSEAGFGKVTVATDVDKAQLEFVLQQFAGEATDADWAMIYYAGHGVEIDARNFLIPIDATLDGLRDIATHAVAMDKIVGAAASAKKLRLVTFDACRDNPFVQEAHRVAARDRGARRGAMPAGLEGKRDIGGGFAGLQPAEANTVVLFSTQPGQVALDGDELNSPFTRAFLSNIPVPGLDLRRFFDRVRDEVVNATDRRQRPAINGRLREEDQFFFFPR